MNVTVAKSGWTAALLRCHTFCEGLSGRLAGNIAQREEHPVFVRQARLWAQQFHAQRIDDRIIYNPARRHIAHGSAGAPETCPAGSKTCKPAAVTTQYALRSIAQCVQHVADCRRATPR